MAALSPSGPAQPTPAQAKQAQGNPITKEPAEQLAAARNAQDSGAIVDRRVPTRQSDSVDEAKPTALGLGKRGPVGPGEEAKGLAEEDVGRHRELDAQQMAAPGERAVYEAVEGKAGASGALEDFASELDRKKAEQAPAREALKEQRKHNVDVAGVLGQTGGPANPVDKNNYPNAGSTDTSR